MELKEKCCLLLGLVLICAACSRTNQESEIMGSRVVNIKNEEALVAITKDSSYMYFRKTTDSTLAVYASPIVEPELYECFVKELRKENWNWDSIYQANNFDFLSKSISINIPKTVSWNGVDCIVTEIGDNAFYGCIGLKSIGIPNTIVSIGESSFYYCSGLTSINIPNSVTSIGDRAFSNCTGLTSIDIPNSVTSLEEEAFSGCTGLTTIYIPNSMVSFSNVTFSGCPNIAQISVASGNTKYDSRENCNAIVEKASNKLLLGCKNTIIPHSVTSIGDWAFYGCTGLTSIGIPNSVISIGDGAFYDCTGLTSISIPNSVTSIGDGAFYDCTGLTSISIPNSVTSIGEGAFYDCTGLTSISIPNSVTSIGDHAFYSCTGLTSISIPNSVTSIGDHAFYSCTGLTSISIPNSVTSIGEGAFYDCTGLTSISIPNSVTSIGASAFEGCESLTTANISSSVTSIEENLYKGCKLLTSIEIPNSVTSIGRNAFKYCESLWTINIPKSVTLIGNGAFQGCKGLASIQIPKSVTSIGMCAFYDCSNVTSVDIPQSIKKIKCDGIRGTSIDIFDKSIILVEQLQGTWEWSGYIYGSRAWDRLEISDGQIVAYSSNGILDQGSFNIDWDNHTIHFGTYSYLDFRFNFYSGWKGLTLYFDKKNGEKYRKISNYSSSYNDNSYSYSLGGSSTNTRFTTDTDVINYTSSHTFINNVGNSIKINFQGMYVNGSLLTNAPRVLNFSGSSATISVTSPYTGGGAMIIRVDASRGTITDGSGDVFWIVN